MKKILISVLLFFCFTQTKAVTLIIKHVYFDHTPGNHYASTDRQVVDEIVNLQGVPKLQSRTIHIHCSGNGSQTCPANLVVNDQGAPEAPSLTPAYSLAALNAMQVKFDEAIASRESGTLVNSYSGTIVTPTNELILYSISWATNTITNETIFNLTFNPAPNTTN